MKNIKLKAFSLIEMSIVLLIIGILVAGAIQATRVIAASKLSTARTITQSSSIAAMVGLVAWFETTSETSFDYRDSNDTFPITNWYDTNPQNITKNNAQQSSGSASLHPLYKLNCINGLPCLQFDGSARFIDATLPSALIQEMSVFVVANFNNLTGTQTLIATTGGTDTSFILQMDSSAIAYVPSSGSVSSAAISAKNVYISTVIDNGSSAILYLNGTASTPLSTAGTYKSFRTLSIGSYNDGTRANYLNGNISEIIIFNRALKPSEKSTVEAYLAKKWAVAISS